MRLIEFQGRITVSSMEDLVAKFRNETMPWVHVDSPGGNFEFFSRIGPAIQRRGITTLSGNVRSAAVILYLLGHRRYALPDSTFFFHEVRVFAGPRQSITVSNVEEFEKYERQMSDRGREAYQEWRRQMRSAQNWFTGFIADRVGIERGFFLNLMRQEATIGPEEAQYYGLVHEILPSNFLREQRK